MIGSKLTFISKVAIALALTTAVMLVGFAGVAWWGVAFHGDVGWRAAVVASLVCWVSGSAALGVLLLHRDPQQVVNGVMFGMLFRMGLPLAVGVMLQASGSELVKAGVLGMMVVVYQLGLFVETLMAWWIVETSGSTASRMAKAS